MQIDIMSNDPDINPIDSLVLELIQQGEHFFSSGDFDRALSLFHSALDIDPGNARSNSDIGVIYWQTGNANRAVQYWLVAFRTDPSDRTVALNLAEALEVSGQHAAARHVFTTYLKLVPDDDEVAAVLRVNQELTMSATELASEAGVRSIDHASPLLHTLMPKDFTAYTYSKYRHFTSLAVPYFHKDKLQDNCDLKVIQDMVIYNFLLSNFPRGARILEVGGGYSRIIEAFRHYFECWNLDKFAGNGNGPTVPKVVPGTHLVMDYLGNFNGELPDNYFDCVFSISTLEHVPEEQTVFNNIVDDIQRVLCPGGYSVHCFDIVIRNDNVWTNGLLPHLFENVKTINPWVDFSVMVSDPDLYVLPEQYYSKSWQAITGKTYHEFGKPLSYNVLWRK